MFEGRWAKVAHLPVFRPTVFQYLVGVPGEQLRGMRKRMSSRLPVALLLLLGLPACTTWRTSAEGPAAIIPTEAPEAVRLTTYDGAIATIRAPILRNDSIVSSEPGEPALALSEVREVEVRRFDGARTVGLAAAGVAGAALWTAVLVGSGGEGEEPDDVPKLSPNLFSGLAWLGRLVFGS